EARDALIDILAQVADFMSPGNPFVMAGKAEDWNSVLRLVSGQIGELNPTLFEGVGSWSGRSGYRYRGLPDQQAAALSGVKSHISALSSTLSGHATAIVREWIELAATVLKYLIEQTENASRFVTADPLEWL